MCFRSSTQDGSNGVKGATDVEERPSSTQGEFRNFRFLSEDSGWRCKGLEETEGADAVAEADARWSRVSSRNDRSPTETWARGAWKPLSVTSEVRKRERKSCKQERVGGRRTCRSSAQSVFRQEVPCGLQRDQRKIGLLNTDNRQPLGSSAVVEKSRRSFETLPPSLDFFLSSPSPSTLQPPDPQIHPILLLPSPSRVSHHVYRSLSICSILFPVPFHRCSSIPFFAPHSSLPVWPPPPLPANR